MVPLARHDVERILGIPAPWPMVAYGGLLHQGRRKPRLVAYGGLVWRFPSADGNRKRCDIWLEPVAIPASMSRPLVRWARRMLLVAKQMGEREVFCIRDEHPNSAKLLRLAGLSLVEHIDIGFDDGTKRNGELWRWQL